MFDRINTMIIDTMSKEEVHQIIENNKKEFFEEIRELTELIKDGKDKESIIHNITKSCKKELADVIVRTIDRNLRPFEETSFIREMDDSLFTSRLNYCINNIILIQETDEIVCSETGLDEKEIDIFITMLNTACNWIVLKRHSNTRFSEENKEVFRFSDEKTRILWNSVYENRKDLKEAFEMENLSVSREIKRDLDRVLDVFLKIASLGDE